MHFLNKLSKVFTLSVIIICSAGLAAFCQTKTPASVPKDIIDSGSVAKVFAPGVISSPFNDAVVTFSPDGNTAYFFQGTIYSTVCFSKMANGKWTKPKVIPFSGRWSDWDPFLSPDGKRLFFVSNRPLDSTSQDKPPRKSHIWYADHLDGDNWSAPHYINEPFNLDGIGNYAPTVSNAGTLFFYSPNRDKNNKEKSYYAKWLGNHYDEPKGLLLNGDNEISDPFIAPDESYIVFVSGNDLYISFRQGDSWTTGQKLGPQVNNGDSNFDPTVSRDGKMLYYASARVQGFYKRDQKGKALNYDELTTEMQSIFNGKSNILMIPINIPKGAK